MNPSLSLLIVPAASAVATSLVLAVLLKLAHALPVDHPNHRSLHETPIPRIGGLAVFPGIVVGCAIGGFRDIALPMAFAGILFIVSIIDDWRNLPAGLRFGAHFAAAAAIALWVAGVSPLAVAGAVAIAWMTNLYNFMDGANGLAGGMAVVGFGILGLASDNAVLAWAVAGSSIGFLVYNFDPARVFLGDSGSIPLGYLAGVISFAGVADGRWPLWFPLMVFAPFVIDATVTLVRRMVRRERFWAAHRQHYYQRLVRMGWTHRRLALTEYALMLTCGLTGLVLLHLSIEIQVAGVVTCLALHVLLMAWIDRRWVVAGGGA